MDGKMKYSDIKMVEFDKEEAVNVYPNPFRSQVNISFAATWLNQPIKISLYNLLGQQVWSKIIDHAKEIESFPVNKLANGFYMLKLEQSKAGTVYKKIQVVN